MAITLPDRYWNPARNKAMELSVNCDFSMVGLEQASHMLGGIELGELMVICSFEWRLVARKLQAEHGFELVLVPAALLRTPESWAVWYQGRCVYTDGCF